MNEVYLDYNGSAPLDPRVAEAMVPVLRDGVGNASSAHRFGQRQAGLVEAAREQVAELVGTGASGVVFCSGATEANNLALAGLVEGAPADRNRVVVSAVEHASVAGTARWLFEQGRAKVDVVGVTEGGFVDLEELDRLLGPDVLAVSVMAANSETGVLNPVEEIAELAHSAGAVFHCDAVQMAGRLPVSVGGSAIDLLSLSGHKMCGPAGTGALVGTRRALLALRPLVHGGGHERGLRSGSLNVAGIAGFGVAANLALQERGSESARVGVLRDRLVEGLRAGLSGVSENGNRARRLPNTANVRFEGADAEAVVFNMDPVAVSAGSACSSGAVEPSRALLAMGLSRDEAFESVRFSLGRFTTRHEVDVAIAKAIEAVERVRALTQGGG
ncbi:cysteine desulfurase family protein [Candidatus Poriferisocius sp.]|uniref:cysteine desulfurase family protein n=1 Tax=Candidatus Poriferisocius sp. TaxID=3101276 RepID=UPI003B0222A5